MDLFLSTTETFGKTIAGFKRCRSYQFGVVGGDLEGRLLVSRCSDENDLCRTGFHTIPPTTRWYTGPLQIRKEKKV